MKKTEENKVIFITGTSSGIGKALAYRYAEAGANVILTGLELEIISVFAKELSEKYQKCIALKADVTNDQELKEATHEGIRVFGKIDIVIANAGFGLHGKLEDLKLEDYKKQFEVNVFGVLRTIYATLAELKKSKGTLCIIGSVNGVVPFSIGSSPYIMSKFAIRGLIETLSLELSPYGIHVIHIMPGFVATNFDHGKSEEEKRQYGWLKISAEKAADSILKAVRKKRPEVVLTPFGKLAVYLERYVPTLIRLANKLFIKYK